MSIHNICFGREMKKISFKYSLLSLDLLNHLISKAFQRKFVKKSYLSDLAFVLGAKMNGFVDDSFEYPQQYLN